MSVASVLFVIGVLLLYTYGGYETYLFARSKVEDSCWTSYTYEIFLCWAFVFIYYRYTYPDDYWDHYEEWLVVRVC